MRPLKEVLESLDRELRETLPTRLASAKVRLEVVPRDADPSGISWWVRTESDPAPSAGGAPHVLELELELHPFGRPAGAPVRGDVPATAVATGDAAPDSPAPTGVDAEAVAGLAGVLGAPGGFAAYCRADTLATALESLRDEDWPVFVEALERSAASELDPVVQAAWGTFRNALRSGPAGSVEAGLARIREPLQRWDRGAWIRLLRTHWRNEPAPVPDPPGIRVDSPSSRN